MALSQNNNGLNQREVCPSLLSQPPGVGSTAGVAVRGVRCAGSPVRGSRSQGTSWFQRAPGSFWGEEGRGQKSVPLPSGTTSGSHINHFQTVGKISVTWPRCLYEQEPGNKQGASVHNQFHWATEDSECGLVETPRTVPGTSSPLTSPSAVIVLHGVAERGFGTEDTYLSKELAPQLFVSLLSYP